MTEKKPQTILGIDPGFAITGWAVLKKEKNKISVIDYGVINTSVRETFSQRLLIVYEETKKIIKKHKPSTMGIEKIYFSKNTKTAIDVGHSRGVMLLLAAQYSIKIKEFTPLQIKQATAAYGRAEKSQMQKMIQLILKLPELPQPDDAADALAIAWHCANNN